MGVRSTDTCRRIHLERRTAQPVQPTERHTSLPLVDGARARRESHANDTPPRWVTHGGVS